MSMAGMTANPTGWVAEPMAHQPSFVVEDQSAVIDFLTAHLKPERRVDTHGAVVFLTRERAYKLKRAVKFPYMDFSTVAIRAAMCRAEIDINHKLAPEIYLGVAAVRRAADGTLSLGDVGAFADDAVDWLVVMRRFDEEGMLDRMAAQGGAMGHVESAFPAFGQRGSGGGDDDGFAHGGLSLN